MANLCPFLYILIFKSTPFVFGFSFMLEASHLPLEYYKSLVILSPHLNHGYSYEIDS